MSVVEAAVSKVTAGHLARTAYLYVRQSTLRQVLNNTESATRQYALRQRAVALGWPVEQIVDDRQRPRPVRVPRPLTAKASSISSPRSGWAGPGSCSGSRSPGWPATTPTGIGCWRSAPSPTR